MSTLAQAVVVGPFQPPTGGLNLTAAVSLGAASTVDDDVYAIVFNETVRTVTGVADAEGAYTIVGSTASGGPGRVDIYRRRATSVACGSLAVATLSGNSGDNVQVALVPVAGLLASQAGVQSGNETPIGQMTHTGTSLTPPNATGIMIVAALRGNGNYSAIGPAFTDNPATGSVRTALAYLLNPSAETAASFTSDDAEDSVIKSIILVGASAAANPKLLLLGVG